MNGANRKTQAAAAQKQTSADDAGRLAQSTLARASDLIGILESKLSYADADRADLATRLIASESQVNRLTTLYVATYQLHATLDPEAVKATIADIAINLLGAEVFALLLKGKPQDGFEVAMSEGAIGLPGDGHDGRYRGNDALVERAFADGGPCFGPIGNSSLLAAIPLTSQGDVVGVLVIRKLLDHHTVRLEEDRELLYL